MRQSPFLDILRPDWAPLATWDTRPLGEDEIRELHGWSQSLSIEEVETIYLPLARLVRLRIQAALRLAKTQAHFLGHPTQRVPFMIGLAGSVAVGKSTTARVLQALLERSPGLTVARVTTDGFLLPNAELQRRGILDRKGFPESYDQRALLDFVHRLRGEFAFALFDARDGRLWLGRDRFGVKPLVYARTAWGLVAASEAKALFALGVPANWDGMGFAHAVRHQYLPPRVTLFEGVRALSPGTLLAIDAEGRIEERRYAHLAPLAEDAPAGSEGAVTAFRNAMAAGQASLATAQGIGPDRETRI